MKVVVKNWNDERVYNSLEEFEKFRQAFYEEEESEDSWIKNNNVMGIESISETEMIIVLDLM